MKRTFASDNSAGVHPAVLEAIASANEGHVIAYGEDPYTERAVAEFHRVLGPDVEVYLVFGGTGANVVGLKAVTESYHSIVCAATSHIYVDECSAPERYLGCKLIPVATSDGKLRPADVEPHLRGFGVEHHAQPRVISITQATEYGTVYRPEEIRALADLAHRHNMVLHMDGARISNAAAGLGVELRTITGDQGVDVLAFGGTKCGLLGAEAVIFFRQPGTQGVPFFRKQAMQLPSKMRFLAAQFEVLLRDELWRDNARHANRMATLLADRVRDIPGVEITQPVEANAVFARIPSEAIRPLQERFFFYVWDERTAEVRWMTAFDTGEEDVEAFAAVIRDVVPSLAD